MQNMVERLKAEVKRQEETFNRLLKEYKKALGVIENQKEQISSLKRRVRDKNNRA